MDKLLSLCMIVRDEEKVLDRCLSSVQGLVDEIIIVDTGSTDRTKEIAATYTSQVYDHVWNKDFAEARNVSLRHATGKWILMLDADEYVQPNGHLELRAFLQSYVIDKPCGFTLKILNLKGSGDDKSNFTESSGARIFANGLSIRYVNPIHEQLISNSGTPIFKDYPFSIFHTGYTEQTVRDKQKSARNLSILEKMNGEDRRNDPYFCFVLGNEYANTKRSNEALDAYRRSYRSSRPTDTWYSHLLENLSSLSIRLEEFDLAYKVIRKGQSCWPGYVDFHCLEGILLEQLGLWKLAENKFKQCLEMAEEADRGNKPYWLIDPTLGRIVPHQMIADIRWRKGDGSGAVHHWTKVLQLQPKNYEILGRLWDALAPVSAGSEISSIVERLYPLDFPLNVVLLHKMALNAGHAELTLRYEEQLANRHLPLDKGDIALRHLLLRDWTPEVRASLSSSALTDSVAVAAAILQQDPSIALLAKQQPAECKLLAEQALRSIEGCEWDEQVLLQQEDRLVEVLQLLWRWNYRETYSELLQATANGSLLNRLGNWFYNRGLLEQALELYDLLLTDGLLGGIGLRDIGIWNLNYGNTDEALPFLEASFELTNAIFIFGLYKEAASEFDYHAFKKKYADRLHNVPVALL